MWFKGLQARGYAVAPVLCNVGFCGTDFCELDDGSGHTADVRCTRYWAVKRLACCSEKQALTRETLSNIK